MSNINPIFEANMRTVNRALIGAGFHQKQADFIEKQMRELDDDLFVPGTVKEKIIEDDWDAWKIIADSFPFGATKQRFSFWYNISHKLRMNRFKKGVKKCQ